MNTPGIVVRSWNDTPIQRRESDGYVNATAMCNANGRRWAKYAESERCREYLQALAQRSGFRTIDLIEARPGRGGGTFVHPSIAIDLARWVSPAFAVWMDGWFLEEAAKQSATGRQRQSSLPPFRMGDLEAILSDNVPVTTSSVLPWLGLPVTLSNQMALAAVLRQLGYVKRRVRMPDGLQWVFFPPNWSSLSRPVPAQPQPQPLPEGIHVVAATPRRAAELWHEAITREVTGALSRRLNPAHRHDSGLPLVTGYQWQQLVLPA